MTSVAPAIVFDLGGVLIDWNPRHLYRKLFQDERAMESFLSNVCSPAWNSQQDAGRPFQEAIAELVAIHPEHEALIRAFIERWDEMVKGPIPGTVSILDQLRRRGHSLYALSNWSAETFPRVLPRFQFLGWFQDIVISGQTGTRKPDPRIYHLLLERVNRDPGNCLFIDDSEENIQAAQKIGFSTVCFESPQQLESALRSRGLL